MENSGPNDRLTSWKEIALYLGRDVRTCWRWEKKYGLPIHRVDPESAKSRVYAFKDDRDAFQIKMPSKVGPTVNLPGS